jgi:hypothetical protein
MAHIAVGQLGANMNLESLRSLQKRIRESKGVDPRLDRDIAFALTDWTLSSQELPPIFTADPDGLGPCVALLRSVLPGCAWKVGEIEWGSIWDTGIDIDRRPSGNVCLALLDAIISALIAQEEAKHTEKAG